MTGQTVTRGSEQVRYRPMYARVLALRHLRPGGMLCFLYFEGAIALSLLLALAELVSWWVVLILPASIAVMVKVNDLVAGAVARSAARTPEVERERLRREVSAFMPMVGRAAVVTPSGLAPSAGWSGGPAPAAADVDAVVARSQAPATAHLDAELRADTRDGEAGHDFDAAGAGLRDTVGRYAAAARHLDTAWRQHAYAMAHHADHAEPATQRERQSASRRYE